MWTKFKRKFKNEHGEWEEDYIFYKGDFSKIDLSKDRRTKEVEGKRHKLEIVERIK